MSEVFDTIVGHRSQIEQLTRLARADMVPHALLFAGPDGVGKRSCAIALASLLLELSSKKPCEARSLVLAGTHPDLHTAEREEGKKDVSVETIRQLRDALQFRSYHGGAIVAIVNEAERMNSSAYNALLKTLEEPNPGTYLILITSALHAMPETIRSRCQSVYFSELPTKELTSVLRQLCPESELMQKHSKTIADFCSGSLGMLALESFCNVRTIGIKNAAAVERHILEQVKQYEQIEQSIVKVVGSQDQSLALSTASTLCAAKGSEPLIWAALRATLRAKLLRSPTDTVAEVLNEVIAAEHLATGRNVAPTILCSELFSKCAML